MPRRTEDSPVWIGYADFLTTLAILFFVIAVGYAGKVIRPKSGYVLGTIRAADTGQVVDSGEPLSGCFVKLGEGRQLRSRLNGGFEFRIDSLREAANIGLAAQCERYNPYREVVAVSPAETTLVRITLVPAVIARADSLSDSVFAILTVDSLRRLESSIATLKHFADSLKSPIWPTCKSLGVANGPIVTIVALGGDQFRIGIDTLDPQQLDSATKHDRLVALAAKCRQQVRYGVRRDLSAAESERARQQIGALLVRILPGPLVDR